MPDISLDEKEHVSLCEALEPVLDKGIVIAGDIRIGLVDVELLTIQLRLVICSVDKARRRGHVLKRKKEDQRKTR